MGEHQRRRPCRQRAPTGRQPRERGQPPAPAGSGSLQLGPGDAASAKPILRRQGWSPLARLPPEPPALTWWALMDEGASSGLARNSLSPPFGFQAHVSCHDTLVLVCSNVPSAHPSTSSLLQRLRSQNLSPRCAGGLGY